MTFQQIVAIQNPCEVAEKCANPRYLSSEQRGRYIFSKILTVNVGEE